MSRRIWPLYLAAWIPVFLFYSIGTQGDALFHGQFNLGQGLFNAACVLGPAILLLSLLWPLTGYLERVGRSPAALVGVHFASAILFSVFCLTLTYACICYFVSRRAAQSCVEEWFIWQSLFYLMMYAVVTGIFHTLRAVEAMRLQSLTISQAETLLAKSELTALRNKLNPHFLFNTLHSIIALTRKDSSAAEAALLKFSDMLRYILDTEKSGDSMVTLDQELQFVRDYLDLESLRLGTRLQVEWHIDETAIYHCVPALTVQPLVENSIKHAFNPRSHPGKLVISARTNAATDGIDITVSDDGPGCEVQAIQESSGFGVKTVERRLKLEYGQRSNVDIRTEPGAGFAVHLSIPLELA
ncbi:sensor histidine kinase [Collimonas sp.]|jgi:sensor histidine kinase YesM|uniref:sensor histidine kinase n=1 Tax=Collimonas sp. TaxID=1963772 RepID=UPI002C47A934|nr:histidine kinase [Collimonas sp.]HWW03992.1 histidine kinase [Collimonas sp.]